MTRPNPAKLSRIPKKLNPICPPVEDPVFVKDFEITDHNETDNNEDFSEFQGENSDFISNQPFKGYGLLDTMGHGGGGGGAYGGRFGGKRDRLAKGGGSSRTESSVNAALLWLKRHQDEDGKWDSDGFSRHCGNDVCTVKGQPRSDSAQTGMALLAFLGAGHTHKAGKFKDTVLRGLEWLLKIQGDDGDLRHELAMYCHGMAAMALVEAYGMTNDYKLKDPAQKAIDFIVAAQKPYSGWRYVPRHVNSDTSVVGWQVMALKSGKMAGLTIPPQTWEGVRIWLESCSAGEYKGLFKYSPSRKVMPTVTSIGMVCLLFMGDNPGDMRFEEGAKYLEQHPFDKGHNRKITADPPTNFYYWYYGTIAMNLIGGQYWKDWNETMKQVLLSSQRKGGHADGSWDSGNDPCMSEDHGGGRVMATAMGALCMEVYYRYNLMLK